MADQPQIAPIQVYLTVRDGDAASKFYQRAFGAKETMRLTDPNGRVGHAEIQIGKAPIMLADEFPEMGIRSPQAFGGSAVEQENCAENLSNHCGVGFKPAMLAHGFY